MDNAVRTVVRYTQTPCEKALVDGDDNQSSIHGTRGLDLPRGSEMGWQLYVDVDWASQCNREQSVSGMAVMSGDTMIRHNSDA